jgi:hypothetical protein
MNPDIIICCGTFWIVIVYLLERRPSEVTKKGLLAQIRSSNIVTKCALFLSPLIAKG